MKKKYVDEDGSILELTDDEFVERPFNVRLRLLDSPDYEEIREEDEAKKAKEALMDELVSKVGFSKTRAEKVVKVYPSTKELLKAIKKLPFSETENKVLRAYYGKDGE